MAIVKSGFKRTAFGSLNAQPGPQVEQRYDTGFLRSKPSSTQQGNLLTTTSLVNATWKGGFLRGPEGYLVIKDAATAEGAVWKSGHYRDKNGALITTESVAETPITWWGGFLRNKKGALIAE